MSDDLDNFLDLREDESLCKLIGIDIDEKVQEILKEEKLIKMNNSFQKFM
jgi:hypothetical protein